MSWATNLQGVHYNIAAYAGGPLRVTAGPGTGKTFALMRRVARLLESGVPPKTILAVTFTRTAAKDLVDKLSALGVPGAQDVVAKTLHALSFSILSQNTVFQATGRTPRGLLQFESDCLISDLGGSFGGKDTVKDLLMAFESYWATLQHHQPGWPQDPTHQAFHLALRQWLIFHESILIGELVPLALDYIKQNPASPFVPHFDYVLADEYQDLNRADQELIDILANGGELTAIGDEDQSIYSFRHAHPDGITKFDIAHPGTHDETLTECRRCPHLVVGMASSLIVNNSRASGSCIQPFSTNCVGDVHIVQHGDLSEEIENVAAYADWYLKQNPTVAMGEILVLATRRAMGYAIRDSLVALGRPAKSFFSDESLDEFPAKEGLCLLTLLVRADDRTAFRAWLGIDHYQRRTPAYQRLRKASDAAGMGPRQYLDAVIAGQVPQLPHMTELMQRYQLLRARLASIAGQTGSSLVDQLWPAGDPLCAEIRSTALPITSPGQTADELLDAVIEAVTRPELPGDQDGIIRIMSLHKSKGLTAKCVIVSGCVAGALPRVKNNLTQNERQKVFEEQRRLFYVAITRTTGTLVLSSAATAPFAEAMQMGITVAQHRKNTAILQASPFISELGSHGIATVTGRNWRKTLGF
jgi:DNA helicase II / ATP-dependent DNA helicase PcrA